MSLHQDLLEQAEHLARREPRKPRQASLRRAVSAAYYALFHLLVSDGALRMAPNKPTGLRMQAGRAFSHREMKDSCERFARGSVVSSATQSNLLHLITPPLDPVLVSVAAAFVDLQQSRHDADYNLRQWFDRVSVLRKVDQVRQAMADWSTIRGTPQANVFLAALLLQNRWGR